MVTSLLNRWSETISIKIPSTADKYNQYTYTDSTILGRLIQSEEEVLMYNNNLQDRKMGNKVLAKAKLFTTSDLEINTKIGDYSVISKKACKDKNNVINFYKYYLK